MFLNVKIKEARLDKKMTQQQLANELTKLNRKTSNTAIANWESGLNSPDVDTLELICRILDKDGNYFFDISDSEVNYKEDIKDRFDNNSKLLFENFNKLNNIGKQKVSEYAEDLTHIDIYVKFK